ncbi:MAG: prepilin-type N-terminal cleavage/methylation domain-containing protein [Patescibacteria group bacterium]|jgi:competence protein ComGC
MKTGNNKGFTLVELILFIAIIGIVVLIFGALGAVVMGNYWVDKDEAMNCIKTIDPTISAIDRLEKKVYWSTVATAKNTDGVEKKFLIDANVFRSVDCEAK